MMDVQKVAFSINSVLEFITAFHSSTHGNMLVCRFQPQCRTMNHYNSTLFILIVLYTVMCFTPTPTLIFSESEAFFCLVPVVFQDEAPDLLMGF